MANFKVGQRVRIARYAPCRHPDPRGSGYARFGSPIGKTATITHIPSSDGKEDCAVLVDDYPRCPEATGKWGGAWACSFAALEPLTDPRADQFVREVTKPNPAILNQPVTA